MLRQGLSSGIVLLIASFVARKLVSGILSSVAQSQGYVLERELSLDDDVPLPVALVSQDDCRGARKLFAWLGGVALGPLGVVVEYRTLLCRLCW